MRNIRKHCNDEKLSFAAARLSFCMEDRSDYFAEDIFQTGDPGEKELPLEIHKHPPTGLIARQFIVPSARWNS